MNVKCVTRTRHGTSDENETFGKCLPLRYIVISLMSVCAYNIILLCDVQRHYANDLRHLITASLYCRAICTHKGEYAGEKENIIHCIVCLKGESMIYASILMSTYSVGVRV